MQTEQNNQNTQPTPPSSTSRNNLLKYLQVIWTRLDMLGQRMTTLEDKTDH